MWRRCARKNQRLLYKPPSGSSKDSARKLVIVFTVTLSNRYQGYHVQITARSDRDLTPESIVKKVSDASGAKYSGGGSTSSQAGGPPPVASKPVFNPTRAGISGGFNPLASTKARTQRDANADEDGWGADAPPIIRSQLEKVAPAYKPTKVNMAELTSQQQKPVPTPFTSANRGGDSDPDVVRGGYQPVGKVDIAAIRAQAKNKQDDRPTTVKGAYEPVGKVDIAAIRAKAQKPTDDGPSSISPAVTGTSATSNDGERPKSLADRSAAFNTTSERLTTLPKPKVANRFGSNTSNFSGTKAPTPGQFGLQSAPAVNTPPPSGMASRTFADQGGKTPAQIWQEKKARERGLSGAADTNPPAATSPMASQNSGGGEWKSGYTGKSWAAVNTNTTGRSAGSIGKQDTGDNERESDPEREETPAASIGSLKDRFKGGAQMGAPHNQKDTTDDNAQAPPLPGGRPGGSLPTRGRADEDDEEEQSGPNIPPPPPAQRNTSPSPERSPSPPRVAVPVSRLQQAAPISPPEERKLPPVFPTESIDKVASKDRDDIPAREDGARNTAAIAAAVAGVGAATAVGIAASGAGTVDQGNAASGKRALIQYDYARAEDNEVELVEGEYVTNIEMVDEDWWMGTNSRGESGLFPSNYVELVDDEEEDVEPEPAPAPPTPAAVLPAQKQAGASAAQVPVGPTATAIYDYEAAEDNELSFEENATITQLVSPCKTITFRSWC